MENIDEIRLKYTNFKKMKKFTEAVGLNYSTYYNYASGRTPDLETIIKISDYLGIDIDTLLGREKKGTSAEVTEVVGTDQRAIQKLAVKLDDEQAAQVYQYMLFVIEQKNNKYHNFDF